MSRWLLLYPFALFGLSLLGLSSCRSWGDGRLWTMTATPTDSLDSVQAVLCQLFVPEGGGQHRLELFLLHDNRTEEEGISLSLSLIGKQDTIYQGIERISLAHSPGMWIGQGLLQHEVEFSLAKPLYIRYPGIYTLKVYSPMKPSPRGINLIGARLINLSKIEQTPSKQKAQVQAEPTH